MTFTQSILAVIVENIKGIIIMKGHLSKERLENYAVSHADYYEKYREKFNKKGPFNSWNWSMFLLPYIWIVYRKMWGPYFILLGLNIIISPLAYTLVASQSLSEVFLIISGLLMLSAFAYVLYLTIRANSLFLANAQFNGIEEDDHTVVFNGKSKWHIVLLASFIYLVPNIIAGYNINRVLNEKRDALINYTLSTTNGRDTETVNLFIKAIDVIEIKNINNALHNRTVADNSVCVNSPEVLQRLKDKGARFTTSTLVNATKCDAPASVLFLIHENVYIDEVEKAQLICNVIDGNMIALLKALLSNEKDISHAVCRNSTPLEEAMHIQDTEKRLEVIDLLLAKGANPTHVKEGNNSNALSAAIKNNDLIVVKHLLDTGIDPNENNDLATPLFYSIEHPEPMMKLLLDYKSDPNEKYRDDRRVLSAAITRQRLDLVKLLIFYGANVTKNDYNTAIETNNKKIIGFIRHNYSK
jgi:hypothetical protein